MFRNNTNDFFRNTFETEGAYFDVNNTYFTQLTRGDAFGQTNATNSTFFLTTNLTLLVGTNFYKEEKYTLNDTINGTNSSDTTFR